MMLNNQASLKRFVWDKTVRLTHWLVALCVFANWFLTDHGADAELYAGHMLHEYVGYFAVFLIVLRLLWSVSLAKKPARLRDLLPTPAAMKKHWQEMRYRQAPDEPGHNAFGLLAIWGMWSLVLAIALSGYLMDTDWGIDHDVDVAHAILNKLLMALVCLHVSAVVLTSWWCRYNLVRPMIHK